MMMREQCCQAQIILAAPPPLLSLSLRFSSFGVGRSQVGGGGVDAHGYQVRLVVHFACCPPPAAAAVEAAAARSFTPSTKHGS